jgi:hypothetical protein
MGMTVGTGLTLIIQFGGIAIAGSFLSGVLEARGSKALASLVSIGTYAIIGALAVIQIAEFIDFAKEAFNL